LLGLSRAGFYYRPQGESDFNLLLMRLIDQEYTRHPFFGYRKMRRFLRELGYPVSKNRVQRLMQVLGLEAICPGPTTSQSHPKHPVYPYRLRGMCIERTDQVWSCDITYLPLPRGFVYLFAVMDWFSRFVLAWEISTTLDMHFCLVGLDRALALGQPVIFTSDQGSQFPSQEFTGRLLAKDITISMDGRGRALDTIFVERLWRTVKYEDVYLNAYASPKEVCAGLREYFQFYNWERPQQSLDYRTPAAVYHG
jgi:putative transposase